MVKIGTMEGAVAAVQRGEISAKELVEDTLEEIERWEPHIASFIEVLGEEAKQAAGKLRPSTDQPLSGIPIGIKDVICTLEGHTTAASNALRNFRSPFDATVVKRLKKAGAIIVGKLNCDAFAMGASTDYSDFKVTKNPWDSTLVSGGSSGGSAAAVASGQLLVSLGTDTGGSIRHPSSLCGVVGLKPTYGRVSRFGAIAYGSSLDQIGPVASTVKDVALVYKVIAGKDPADATSSPMPVKNYPQSCGLDIKGMKVGVPKEFFGEGVTPEVVTLVRSAIKQLEELGAKIKEISLPLTSAGIPVYYLIAKVEGSTNLSRYDSIRFGQMELSAETLIDQYLESRGKGFGPEVKRTILMGTYALSAGYYEAWYKQASRVRTLIKEEFVSAFDDVDIIVGPAAPETAWPVGERAEDPLAMYMTDILFVTVSVSGLPALSVPCGFAKIKHSKVELPVGMQLIAPHFQEERLFQVGHAYEQATEWHRKKPTLPRKAS